MSASQPQEAVTDLLLRDLLTALPTIVIAGIAVYIAYQQWQTNRRRLDLDLYDRRLRLYQAVVVYTSKVRTKFKPELEDIFELRRATAEADFLFGQDIKDYIDELIQHGGNLHMWNTEYRDQTQDLPADYDHLEIVEGLKEERKWFVRQPKVALQKFKSYLNLVK